MTCALFGHKESPDSIKPLLENEIRKLIENEGYEEFLVGNQGRFDTMAYSALKRLQTEYPAIRCYVVLAYIPGKKDEYSYVEYADTIYPEGLETVPRRFAISRRNKWIVENSNAVICYINHTWGGAYQAVIFAEKRNLSIINLAQKNPRHLS